MKNLWFVQPLLFWNSGAPLFTGLDYKGIRVNKVVPCNFHVLFGLIRVYTKILGVVRKDWWYSPILLVSANLQIINCTSLPRHLEFLWQRLKTLQQSSTSMRHPWTASCWWRRYFHLRQVPSMNFESQLPKHLCWSPQSIPVEENKGKPGFTNC